MAPTPTMTDMYQDANGLWIKTAKYRHAPTPAGGDDMTWEEGYKNIPLEISADGRYIGDTSNPADAWTPLSMVELAKEVRRMQRQNERLQNEMAGLAAQVVELRERMDRNEADS